MRTANPNEPRYPFYGTQAWKRCRAGYVKYRRGLCEKCLERGIYNAGEIVHHKIPITNDNVNDPNVTLNWENLQLLCRECHAEAHGLPRKRYKVLPNGQIVPPYAKR